MLSAVEALAFPFGARRFPQHGIRVTADGYGTRQANLRTWCGRTSRRRKIPHHEAFDNAVTGASDGGFDQGPW